jgi:hypothetical protein
MVIENSQSFVPIDKKNTLIAHPSKDLFFVPLDIAGWQFR